MNRLVRSTVAGLVAAIAAVAAVASGFVASPAWAAAGVSIVGPDGTSTVSAEYSTNVTVSGSGFQAIQNGFGGVYVLFGWVSDAAGGSWKPSQGGLVGSEYRYVPDVESADNAGFQRFIAFSGSQTESSANGVLNADGTWSISMVIPGARFESQDRNGNVSAVDCLEVTCGIITIGAHGVKNANNETFTPVRFAAASSAAGSAGAGEADAAAASAAAAGSVRLGVESTTVVAGTSVVFTGQGFTPGEQVVASLDGGLTAVGPLTAGTQGEVAAALPVPRDIRNGTHLVTLRGAGSGSVAEAEIVVSDGVVTEVSTAPETPQWAVVVLLLCIVIAVALVIASIVTAIARARARRKARGLEGVLSAPAVTPDGVAAAPAPDDRTVILPVIAPDAAREPAEAAR